MRKQIGMYSSWFGYELTTKDQMKLIKEAGFGNVCFWWGSEGFNGPKEDQVKYAQGNGLYIENVHLPFVWAEREITNNPTYKYASCNDYWADNEDGDYVLKRTLESLNECADYEIPIAVTHITIGHNPNPINQIGIDRIKRIIDLAEKRNVVIAAENTHNPEYLEKVFDEIKSDNLKFCYDCGHDRIWGDGFTKIIKKHGEKLVTTHLHDNFGVKDDHLVPGDGNMDFKPVIKEIKDAKYHNSLMFEIMAEKEKSKTESVEEFLSRAYSSINKVFNELLEDNYKGA